MSTAHLHAGGRAVDLSIFIKQLSLNTVGNLETLKLHSICKQLLFSSLLPTNLPFLFVCLHPLQGGSFSPRNR